MPIRSRRPIALVSFAVIASVFIWIAPLDAGAQAAAEKKKTEGCMVSYDAAAGALVVTDRSNKKDETFKVKQGTSVLDKTGTAVSMNGRGAKLVDLEADRPVIVYWATQGEDKFASKVDAPDPGGAMMEQMGCKTE